MMEEDVAGFVPVRSTRKRRRETQLSPLSPLSPFFEGTPSPSMTRSQRDSRSPSVLNFFSALAVEQVDVDEEEEVEDNASSQWQVPASKGVKKGKGRHVGTKGKGGRGRGRSQGRGANSPARKKRNLQPSRRANGKGPTEVIERVDERREGFGERGEESDGSDVVSEVTVVAELLMNVAADGRGRDVSNM